MTQSTLKAGRRAVATLEAVLGLLKALARGRSRIEVADIEAARPVHIHAPGENPDMTSAIPSVAIAEALRRGWIGPMGSESRLGLTIEGRTALRRAISRLADSRAAAGGERAGDEAARSAAAIPGSLNVAESPLAWLKSRRDANGQPILSEAQFTAGERLRVDLTIAGLTPRVTMAWSGTPLGSSGANGSGIGCDVADNVAAARERVLRALTAVGPEAAGLLIDVCGHLKGLGDVAEREGWPRRSAKLVLLQALTALARHYGLMPVISAERTLRERLRHWGAADYRPSLDGRNTGADGEEEAQLD